MDTLKILVADDKARMRKLVEGLLTNKGFAVIEAGDGEGAVDVFFAQKDTASVPLDVIMPKMNSWEVLRTIRKCSRVPVIMLTARSEERDGLQGFSPGMGEYISEPSSLEILVTWAEITLRRTNMVPTDSVDVGGICIDKVTHQVTIDGQEADLSFKGFGPLTYFVKNQGVTLFGEKVLNNVWSYDYLEDACTIDTHMKKLRSKMGEKGEYVKTT